MAISLAACGGAPVAEVLETVTEQPTAEPTAEPTIEPTVEPTPEPTPAPGPLDAVVDGETYTNEFFGFTLDVPAGYLWYTEEEIAATFGVAPHSIDTTDLAAVDFLPLAMCYDPSNSEKMANMNFTFSNTPLPTTDEEVTILLDDFANALDEMLGTETIYAEPTVTEFLGHPPYVFDSQSYIGEENILNQAIIMVEVENGVLTFTYTYFTEEQLSTVIQSAQSIIFSK